MIRPHQSDQPREGLSPLKQAFLALEEAEARVHELEYRASEPIAVVGIGCRIPGAEGGPEDFWRLLQERRCSVAEKAAERFRSDPGSLPRPARWSALLDDVAGFDPRHFGISPREATGMDPQQRLLLEVSWEALENAAVDPSFLYQTKTGVFIGISSHDYAQLQRRGNYLEAIDPHFASGVAPSVAAGRISYILGLNGSALSVDTACSSSLVAVHLACEALRRNECTTALAGGVNLILSSESSIAFSQADMLSPRGVCSAFDEEADGFVRGEGCGVVVLKRLRDAEAEGDRILGVILGSAVNQDGASSGLTVPNGMAQQALLREAQRRAGIEPWQVGYVEAHGTGTTLGDPIEAEALGAVFAGREHKLPIGSVKTNIGHLESAAGVAGLIKVLLGMQHEVIPAQLHWTHPSPHLRWEELPLEVVSAAQPWAAIAGRRIAGVSSFGFSGTNAHVIIESREQRRGAPESTPHPDVLVIAARTGSALRALAGRYADYLESSDTASWREICYTAGVGRAALSERLAVAAATRRQAALQLRAWLRGERVEGLHRGHVSAGQRRTRTIAADAEPQELAAAFVDGALIDWRQRAGSARPARAALPTYAFERERYWIEERRPEQSGNPGVPTSQPLLGRRLAVAGVRAQFETTLSAPGWIGEHKVQGQSVLPATGHLELMLEAAAELGGSWMLEEVVLEARLTVEGERRVQTVVDEEKSGRCRVRIFAEREGSWQPVSAGWLRRAAVPVGTTQDPEPIRSRLREQPAGDAFYAGMTGRGMQFGPRFRTIQRLWSGQDEALGEIVTATVTDSRNWQLQPWWLDACLQVAGAAIPDDLYLPLSLERLEICGRPALLSWSHVRIHRLDADNLSAHIAIFAPDGVPIARLSNLRFRRVTAQKSDLASWTYGVRWHEAARAADSSRTAQQILLIGDSSLAHNLVAAFGGQGSSATRISVADLSQLDNAATWDAVLWADDRSVPDNNFVSLSASAAAEPSVRSLLATAQTLAQKSMPARLYVVTTEAFAIAPQQEALRLAAAPLSGMAASFSMELPEMRCTQLDISANNFDPSLLVQEVVADAADRLVAWRSGQRYVGRLERIPLDLKAVTSSSPVQLQTAAGIDGLTWITAPSPDLQPHEVEIAVRATALNFHDVLQALGVIPDEGPLGTDCAGIVLRTGEAVTDLAPGDAVVAIAPGCFGSHAVAPRALVLRKPEKLSFAEAAAQSVAYLTADYCLNKMAQVRPGQRVLIHAAAGGVGLAAVHLCRQAGAEPIVTAGSEKKRAFLKGLGVAQVYDSRSLAFATEISGGVDIVLNSLAGEAIDRALGLLNPGGQFIELGKTDLRDPASVEQKWQGVRYLPVDLTSDIAAGSSWVGQRLAELLDQVAEGSLPPLPVTSFDSSMVQQAFRFMARAEHIGRVVVTRETADRFSGTHLVTGGLRGIGLKLAEWLAAHGVRSLVLVGRHAPDEVASRVVERLRTNGVAVHTMQGDIADPATVGKAIETAGANLRGVWHCAGLLDNAALENQSWDRLQRVFAPKIDGAWNLHFLTRDLPIDYFVLFSSWASIAGSHGQVNHCAASSFLDGLAQYRRALGRPAFSINWGAWAETGVASSDEVRRRLERSGLESMPPASALEALRLVLRSEEPQIAIASIHWPRYMAQRQSPADRSFYAAMFSELKSPAAQRSSQIPPLPSQAADPSEVTTALDAIYALPAAQRETALLRAVAGIVRRTLDLHRGEEIDPDVPLSDLGMDSLLAVELRNGISGLLHRQFPATMFFDYPTLRALARYLDKTVLSTHDETPVAVPAPQIQIAHPANEKSLDILDAIERMSDEEVESWFE